MSYYVEPFTFQFTSTFIDVDSGVFDVDCSLLYDAIKLAQASEEGIIYDRIAQGSGLNQLGPGVQVGITVELLGTWQLRFPEGNYVARVAGGNLIGGPNSDPIAYSAGVQTLLIQSAASTVVTPSVSGDWSDSEKNQIRHRLGIEGVTSSSSITPSLATTETIRISLSEELARVDVPVSTRLATTTYVIPPSVIEIRSELDNNSIKLDVAVSSRNAVEPDNTGIAAIKAKTDNLPSDPASNSSIKGAENRDLTQVYNNTPSINPESVWTYTNRTLTLGTRDSEIDAIKAKTDNLPSDPASETSVSSSSIRFALGMAIADLDSQLDNIVNEINDISVDNAAIAAAVRTELTPELTRIDTTVSTRLAASSYIVPPTAVEIRSEIDTNSTKLDVPISTRNDIAPDNARILSIETIVSNLNNFDPNTQTVIVSVNNDKTGYYITGTLTTLDALNTEQNIQHTETQSDIAALNNVSTSDVRTEVSAALSIYDAPTKAELDSAFTEIKGAGWSTETLKDIRDNTGVIDNNAVAIAVRTELTPELTRIDTTVSTRLAAIDYVVPPTVTEIRSEIDTNSIKLDVPISTRNAVEPDNISIAAIKSKTDNLPVDPAAASDIPTAVENAVAVRNTLTVELSRIDVTISSRESETDAALRASTNQSEHDATQSAIAGLPSSAQIASDILNTVVP